MFLQPFLLVFTKNYSCGGRSVGRPKRSFASISVKEFAAVSVHPNWASVYYFVGLPPGNVPTPGAKGQSPLVPPPGKRSSAQGKLLAGKTFVRCDIFVGT